jgi:LysR family nitrogen assimilation transcriptional regulator
VTRRLPVTAAVVSTAVVGIGAIMAAGYAAAGPSGLIDAAALAAGIDVHPSVEIDSYRQIKRLVARGAAFAILPISAIEAEVRSGAMRAWRLQKPAIRRRVILAYPADRQLSGASRAVLQLGWHVLRDIVQSGIWRAQWTGAEALTFSG